MKTNHLTTLAVGFALFALWFATSKKAHAATINPIAQAGELQREAGALTFFDILKQQEAGITWPATDYARAQLVGAVSLTNPRVYL